MKTLRTLVSSSSKRSSERSSFERSIEAVSPTPPPHLILPPPYRDKVKKKHVRKSRSTDEEPGQKMRPFNKKSNNPQKSILVKEENKRANSRQKSTSFNQDLEASTSNVNKTNGYAASDPPMIPARKKILKRSSKIELDPQSEGLAALNTATTKAKADALPTAESWSKAKADSWSKAKADSLDPDRNCSRPHQDTRKLKSAAVNGNGNGALKKTKPILKRSEHFEVSVDKNALLRKSESVKKVLNKDSNIYGKLLQIETYNDISFDSSFKPVHR